MCFNSKLQKPDKFGHDLDIPLRYRENYSCLLVEVQFAYLTAVRNDSDPLLEFVITSEFLTSQKNIKIILQREERKMPLYR